MTLPVSYYVYGTIRDHNSSPITGAKVHVQDTDNDQGVVTFTTGADGKYQINVQTNFNDTDSGLIWATGSGEYKKQVITVNVANAALNVDLTLEQLIYSENVGTLANEIKAPARTLTELIGTKDYSIRALTKTAFTEYGGLMDTSIRHLSRTTSDMVGVIESTIRHPQKNISEQSGLLDTKIVYVDRVISDATGFLDTVGSRDLVRAFAAELIGLVDTHEKLIHKLITVSDAFGLADASGARSVVRDIEDAAGLVDTLNRSASRIISDIAGLLDTRTISIDRTLTTELLGLLDTHEKLIHKIITISDAFGLTASPSREVARDITDRIGIIDIPLRATSRIVIDSAGLLDTYTRSINRVLPFELVDISDTHEKLVHKLITISDALGLASPLPEKSIARTISRSTELVETSRKDATRVFSLEIAGLLDTHEKLVHKLITISDMLGLGDTTGPRQISAIRADDLGLYGARHIDATREISDKVGLTDSVNKQLTRLFTDKIGVVDSATKQVAKIFAESLGFSESTTRQLERVLADTVGLFEAHNVSLSRLLTDKIALVGSTSYQIVGGGQKFKTVEEMMGLADSIGYRIISRTITDGVGITDSRLVALTRELNDLISVADSHTKLVHKIITVSDALGMSDSASKRLSRILVDATQLADTISRQADYVRTFSESIGVMANAPKEIRRVIVESAALKHTISREIGKSVLELLSIIDTTGNRAFSREITELLAPRGIISRDLSRIIPTEHIEITDMITVPTFLSFYVDLFLGHIGSIQNTFGQNGSVTITFN